MPRRSHGLLALLAVLAAACSEGPSEPPGAPARVVAVSAPPASAAVGTRIADSLVVRVTDANGRGVPRQSVTWVVRTGFGSVSPVEVVTDDRGYARTSWTLGVRAGANAVAARTVTVDGPSLAEFVVQAVPGPVASIVVSPPTLDLGVGQVRQLTAALADAYGNVVTAPVAWSSSNPGVAAVDAQTGTVTTVGNGTALVRASSGERSASVTVIVGTAIFVDDFNAENGARAADNYTRFVNWDVVDGCVDLVGAPPYSDFLPQANGIGVDLDGTCGNAGTLQSKASFILTPGDYDLSFQLAGSPRFSDPNTVIVSFGSVYRESFTLNNFDPLRTYARPLHVAQGTTVKLVFDHQGGDNYGILLDNVKLVRR